MPRKGTKAPRVFIIGKEVLARRTRSSMKQEVRGVVIASDDDSTHVPADASVPDVEVSSVGEQSMVIDDETIPLYKRKAGKRFRVLSEDEVNAEAAMDISDEPDEGDIAAPVITVDRVRSDELSQSPNAKTNSDDASSEESTHVPADASVPDVEVSSVGEQSMVIDDETIPL
jgi:hypothetical protein